MNTRTKPLDLYPSRRTLVWLVLALLLYVLGLSLSSSDAGAAIVGALWVTLAIRSWPGLTSLGGLIHWSRVHGGRRVWLVVALVLGWPLMPLVYLLRCIWHTWQLYQVERLAAPHKVRASIDRLERELGMKKGQQ